MELFYCEGGRVNRNEIIAALQNLIALDRADTYLMSDNDVIGLGEAINMLQNDAAALIEIAGSKYQNYSKTSPDSYGIGVTDGHRYCADIANKALD